MPKKGQRVTTEDFKTLEGAKARHAPHLFAVHGRAGDGSAIARTSVVVSKKVAKTATARNSIKRRIREIIKKEIAPALPADALFVVHAKKGIEALTADEVLDELRTVV